MGHCLIAVLPMQVRRSEYSNETEGYAGNNVAIGRAFFARQVSR